MNSLEYSSDEEMPNRPLTHSQSETRFDLHRWGRNMSGDSAFVEGRSSSTIPMTELSHDTAREQGVSQLHARANEPVAEPGPSCSYQPEPSTSANRNTEYSSSASLSLRSLSERAACAERSRTWYSNPPDEESSYEESIALGVFETRRPMRPLRCRFCYEGEERGSLLRVCECNHHMRVAHKECLLKSEAQHTASQCQFCGHVIKIRYTERKLLEEMQRVPSSNQPTSPSELVALPRVHVAGSPENRDFSSANCRFCFRGEGEGRLSKVCECDYNSRRAHERCLEMAKEKGITRCRFCRSQFAFNTESNVELQIEEPENERLPEDERLMEPRDLCERIQQICQKPPVKWTLYAISGVSIILYFSIRYFQSQDEEKK